MAPAIFMDLSSNGKFCNATSSLHLSPTAFAVAHMMLFSIMPYLLPFAIIIYPLIVNSRVVNEEEEIRDLRKTTTTIVWSYVIIYAPLALLTIIVMSTALNGILIDYIAVCHFEQLFKFFQEAWIVFVPLYVTWRDPELSRDSSAKRAIEGVVGHALNVIKIHPSGNSDNDRVRLE